ncbi:NB-ARC domain-containing protein [Heracleum sosnowskyi]|uniref:NB-ARC domain-containing protein n=1 Tax=Heracleum sosnowskyi TaxID=360622 RepID=A0AAD8M9B5_9APIA|nr:NB-ARC domain-containing protein [Heracleum sosnowskyi]
MPKDSDIYKDQLIQIWMALGFLLGDGNALMEYIGNEYFDILLSNSLLQDVEKDIFGNVTKCKMHDLVHDLALDVSTDYSATVKPSQVFNKVSKAIHVRLKGFKDVKPNVFKAQLETVKALYAEAYVSKVVLPNLKHLRVLVLHSFFKELPSSIGNLKYLKHLDISDSLDYRSSYKLPDFITRLYSLQTLRIWFRHELPKRFATL